MKLAIVTDDGVTISAHFGRAAYYLVITLENGKIVNRKKRQKLSHAHFSHEPHEAGTPGQPHGFDAAAQNRHGQMIETIADCQVLVARGMGADAYENLKRRGIQIILTELRTVDEAVAAFTAGNLIDRPERLH